MRIELSRKGPGSLCRLVALLAAGSAVLAAASVELKQGEEQVEIIIGGKPFATYYFHRDVVKPYLMPLRTPSGVIVSRPFPFFNDVSMADRKLPGFEPHQRVQSEYRYSQSSLNESGGPDARPHAAGQAGAGTGRSAIRRHKCAVYARGSEQPRARRRGPDLHVSWG